MTTNQKLRSFLAAGTVAAALLTPTATATAAPVPTDRPYAVLDVAALPLSASAKWAPVMGHDTVDGTLRGITRCSVGGNPAAADLDARAKANSPTFTAWLRPGGDSGGWSGSVSAAGYDGINASSYALAAYKRYLDACKTTPERAAEVHNGAVGTSVLDPTEAHALIETGDAWLEVFAVATNDAIVETVFTHPKGGPVAFGYNPASVFGALKLADIDALARKL
ncbi:Uncharacterised protein (plasmid) [Tsukamurella tyrosinosolvens]|uniref:PknH-like extracellular domain-containing protein n=1 Tax=Tsukamurella tyrosinosolvens TaxID=57704 RepID=A0A1H4V0I5_TSUTY|nr:hypothetical protein [Tsukamurella tyrosinosolvens]KXO91100.1 hypothetical protein AXK58_21970 [Tsukamurella tyrosinosolvens]SEC73904.1 hypothetical protein SAMN04489793_3084 [Tsukamurella tyrosinosolvens]VEH90793.1 Uncharacterised protein [Tsukamurella tyrosinosolvens]